MNLVGAGLGLGGLVRERLAARATAGEAQPSPRWLGGFARYTGVFAFTVAVHQLGVAQDFVPMAFGLLFGALGLAALAFGLGARDGARRRHQQVDLGAPAAPIPRPHSGPLGAGTFRAPSNP